MGWEGGAETKDFKEDEVGLGLGRGVRRAGGEVKQMEAHIFQRELLFVDTCTPAKFRNSLQSYSCKQCQPRERFRLDLSPSR